MKSEGCPPIQWLVACVILLQIQECLQVSPQLTDFQVISEGWKLEVVWEKASCSAYSFMITHKFQMWMNSWLALIHTPLWGLNSPQAFANITATSEAGFCPAWEFTVTATWFTYLHISFRSFANAVAKRKSTLNTKDSIAGCFTSVISAVITACWFTRLTVELDVLLPDLCQFYLGAGAVIWRLYFSNARCLLSVNLQPPLTISLAALALLSTFNDARVCV